MPARIYTSPLPPTLVNHASTFSHLFALDPANPATVGGFPGNINAFVDAQTGVSITRTQTRDLALRVAWALRNAYEIRARRGQVVMIFSPNSLSWPVALFGSVAAGLKCTLANSAYTPKELAFQYQDSGATLIFTSEEGIPTVLAMFALINLPPADARKRIIVMETGLEWAGGPPTLRTVAAKGLRTLRELIDAGKALQSEQRFDGKDASETAYLCYSSGTTGKPKGVETTHVNVNAVLEAVKVAFPPLKPGVDCLLGILPFYHIYGAVKLVHFPMICGIPVVIMPRFEPEKFCANIERYRITTALIAPPVLVVLARHPAVDKYDVSSLESLFSGAAPLSADLAKQVYTFFSSPSPAHRDVVSFLKVTKRLHARRNGKGDFAILQGYGLTETSPTTHLLQFPDAVRKVGSIGILLPNLEARLLVDGDGNGDVEAKEGEPGELWVRGPTVMKGYLNNEAATKDSITPDGWFKTGDIAVRDQEGYYYIVDRRKELIKYKGFQVPPAELEGLLLSHPDVADAAVIGVYSESQATELPRAYVVPAHPDTLKTPQSKLAFQQNVRTWTQERVARHKYLRGGVVAIDVVPKSAAGKILRRELRDRAKVELAGLDPGSEEVKAKL
ncbi:hypothetical protein H0H87_004877 [Tephrocybe sp. NHM501043]|nr:hypothetical protein H0H87_004877 [Tephrocybe sp. NHM501043]